MDVLYEAQRVRRRYNPSTTIVGFSLNSRLVLPTFLIRFQLLLSASLLTTTSMFWHSRRALRRKLLVCIVIRITLFVSWWRDLSPARSRCQTQTVAKNATIGGGVPCVSIDPLSTSPSRSDVGTGVGGLLLEGLVPYCLPCVYIDGAKKGKRGDTPVDLNVKRGGTPEEVPVGANCTVNLSPDAVWRRCGNVGAIRMRGRGKERSDSRGSASRADVSSSLQTCNSRAAVAVHEQSTVADVVDDDEYVRTRLCHDVPFWTRRNVRCTMRGTPSACTAIRHIPLPPPPHRATTPGLSHVAARRIGIHGTRTAITTPVDVPCLTTSSGTPNNILNPGVSTWPAQPFDVTRKARQRHRGGGEAGQDVQSQSGWASITRHEPDTDLGRGHVGRGRACARERGRPYGENMGGEKMRTTTAHHVQEDPQSSRAQWVCQQRR